MPYRRLPNTDQSRLHALQTAVQTASEADFTEQVIQYKTLNEAKRFLTIYENQVQQYHQNFQSRVSANKKYKHIVSNARMYISHFIQVLNLSVIRGDIKKEQKELYGLDVNNHILPDLSSEEDLLVWGQNIIDGEEKRLKAGGLAIYNPSIAKVKVHYEIFKNLQVDQQMHKRSTDRTYEDLSTLRTQADQLIVEIWNQVEEYFRNQLPYEKMRNCQKYGIVYYYRSKEQKITPDTDRRILLERAISPTLDLQ